MAFVFTAVIIGWIVSLLLRCAGEKNRKKWIAEVEARQRAEKQARDKQIKQLFADQNRERKERIKAQVEMQTRQITIEKEQERQAQELAKHEAVLQKHEEKINKLMYTAQQAQEDMENCAYRIEELQAYEKYLELERDACVHGGKEYFKWQNKVAQVDDKIYRLTKQMNKAKFVLAESNRKLEEEVA